MGRVSSEINSKTEKVIFLEIITPPVIYLSFGGEGFNKFRLWPSLSLQGRGLG
jgi:hypothetical protein